MIVRDDGASLLLITQPDHAALAETIVAAIRTEASLETAARSAILLATREHDNGWIEVDAEPTIDPATARPCDFTTGPAHIKHDLWRRGVARVGHMDPRAGALVAEHAVTVYGYRRREPDWAPFFEAMTTMRDGLLARIDMLTGAPRTVFQLDYRCVRLGDSLSLHFCHGWHEPHETLGYRAVVRGSTLLISPDPFGGVVIPLRVMARRIPARPYVDDEDLRAALASAAAEPVTGDARGATAHEMSGV